MNPSDKKLETLNSVSFSPVRMRDVKNLTLQCWEGWDIKFLSELWSEKAF